MKITDTEAILTANEWREQSTCQICGLVLDNPCSATMHEDDCGPQGAEPAGYGVINELN